MREKDYTNEDLKRYALACIVSNYYWNLTLNSSTVYSIKKYIFL